MRVLLFTGKGGVGKTTIAAATAVHASRCGVKTLVASTDAAHSLADALDVRVGSAPSEVLPGLFAQQVQPRARGLRTWRGVQEHMLGVMEAVGVDPVMAEELTDLPGAEQVLALLELRDQVRDGGWDLVVVDAAPTAETLRLLAAPEVLTRAIQRLLPLDRRVARVLALAGQHRRPSAGNTGALTGDRLVEVAQRLCDELAGVRDMLVSPSTSVRLVLTPEAVPLAEARRTWTTLSLYGYVVDEVVANRVFPADDGPAWLRAWVSAQSGVLAQVEESFAPVPVRVLELATAEPVGRDALAALAEQLYGPPGAAGAGLLTDAPEAGETMRVERDGAQFALVLDLPLARREDLRLSRSGDELTVGLGEHRRVVALPSVLRRCTVAGASLREGRLRVTFEPDPQLWRAP